MRDPINQALTLFTGYGRSRFPRARTADVAAAFGETSAAELRDRILALYEELKQPLAEPVGKAGRKSVTERAVAELHRRHPELDEEGLTVLSWAYSFGLR
ncbi:MAG TPA: hypothetical protein VGN80_19940 [Devosiaceae bacterium]|nr:hypothetical protein [Devosiaceae bacterium]